MKELTANFDRIYIITVPHQMPCRKLTFWSDQEIIDYANEKDCDAETDNVADAIDIIKSDWNTCKVIRNLDDCFYAWQNATHKAGEIRALIVDILAEEVADEITDYEEAQAFFDKIAENKKQGENEMKKELTVKEIAAIKKVLDIVNLDAEEWQTYAADDSVTINQGRDGKMYAWYYDGTHNQAVDVESGEFLSEEEIERIFC